MGLFCSAAFVALPLVDLASLLPAILLHAKSAFPMLLRPCRPQFLQFVCSFISSLPYPIILQAITNWREMTGPSFPQFLPSLTTKPTSSNYFRFAILSFLPTLSSRSVSDSPFFSSSSSLSNCSTISLSASSSDRFSK